jgi:hypothetical protein
MAGLSVGVANPGQLGTGVINPSPPISGVVQATPGSNGFAGLSAPSSGAVAPKAAAPAAAPAASGSSSAFNAPLYIQGIQQEYGGQLASDAAQAGANTASYGVNQNLINSQAGANTNQINQQATDSLNTLQTQASGVQSGQQLSLAELADQIHGQNQALQSELGTVGAGSSSAVGTGQNALAKVQNTDRANIQEQTGTQVANINAEKQAVSDQQAQQIQALSVWKQQQLAQIMQTYQSNQNSIAGAMQTAQGEEKARLAEFGQSLTQSTSAALQAVDQTVQNTVASITAYQTSQAPTISGPVALATPTPVSAPTVSPFAVGNTTGQPANTSASPTGGGVYALMNQNPQPAS